MGVGVEEVQLAKVEFDFARAATKPTIMTLRLVDKLFSKEVLVNFTVHGTKDFAPLDHGIITAIKGKLTTLNLFYFKRLFSLEHWVEIQTFANA